MSKHHLSVPDWISHDDVILRPVNLRSQALDSIDDLVDDGIPQLCSTPAEVAELISQVLRQDIRGIHQGRGSTADVSKVHESDSSMKHTNEYMCRLDNMLIRFVTNNEAIDVISVSGCDYSQGESIDEVIE